LLTKPYLKYHHSFLKKLYDPSGFVISTNNT